MKSLFWISALCVLAIGVLLVVGGNEMYVQVILGKEVRQMSLNSAVLFLLIGFVAFHVLLRILAFVSSLPRRMRESRIRKDREKATEIFAEGMRLYFSGEARKAMETVSNLKDDEVWSKLAAQLTARAESDLGTP